MFDTIKVSHIDQARELLEIIEVQTIKGSAIFCTLFEPEGWYTRIGSEDDTIHSDAIVDRIIPNSYEIMIEGNISMRERHGIHLTNKGDTDNE